MKKTIFTLLTITAFCSSCFAQDHIITLQGVAFSPNELTINAGETVQWDNQGGTHNVDGTDATNPESFFSGSAAPAPWQFEHTFNTPGVYEYHCDPHVGFGMTGTITVLGQASDVIITEFMYNNPGTDDYEFIELYNNGDSPQDMEGWTLSGAVNFTFPAMTLASGEYAVTAKSAGQFETAFGILPMEWATGSALNNNGETIILSDASGNVIDSVAYEAGSNGWPIEANGDGPSNVLCDYDGDNNDAFNWRGSTTPTGFSPGGVEFLMDPGADSGCPAGPAVSFLNTGFAVLEGQGSVSATVVISSGNSNSTEVTVNMNMSSTAVNGDDFVLTLPVTVTFPAGSVVDTQFITINLVDDMDEEPNELLTLDLSDPTNDATIAMNGGQYQLTILDDDSPVTNALVITGAFDTQVEAGGTWAKGVELQALEDIADLSAFGVSSANNGTGSPMEVETPLPAVAVSAGDCIYVVNDSALFVDFFGNMPFIFEGDAANINGDDAIELLENNLPIDVFGDVNTDGTGEPWEYLDGWAYRNDGTGPDGTSFVLGNWTFSGVDAFQEVPNNIGAPNPFPTCSYSSIPPTTAVANDDNTSGDVNMDLVIDIYANDQIPNPLTSINITTNPTMGEVTINGFDNVTYTPDPDACGEDMFVYEICDAVACDQATVFITIDCPTVYTPTDIADATEVDANGTPVLIDQPVELTGIVHGIDFQGNDNIQFFLIDNTGGISLFSNNNFGYTVTEGDELTVQGIITEFSCLTQITPINLTVNSSDNPLVDPEVTAFLNEDFESELVFMTNVTLVDPAQWLGNGSSFNVEITNGTFTTTMRIDDDTEMANDPWPYGTDPFFVKGLGSQFDQNAPCDVGYQLIPRYWPDFDNDTENTLDPTLAEKIDFFPNPVSGELTIQTDLLLEKVSVANLLGQPLLVVEKPGNSLNVSDLQTGVYLLTFQVDESVWTAKIVKN